MAYSNVAKAKTWRILGAKKISGHQLQRIGIAVSGTQRESISVWLA